MNAKTELTQNQRPSSCICDELEILLETIFAWVNSYFAGAKTNCPNNIVKKRLQISHQCRG